jgi:hypothetical protein
MREISGKGLSGELDKSHSRTGTGGVFMMSAIS